MHKKPWNKNKKVGQKKPFTPRQINILKDTLKKDGANMELVLLSLGVDSMLNALSLLRLRVGDIIDFGGRVEHMILNKAISQETVDLLQNYIDDNRLFEQDFLFAGKTKNGKRRKDHMSRGYYGLLVKKWAKMLGLDPKEYSSHSVAKTMKVSVGYWVKI